MPVSIFVHETAEPQTIEEILDWHRGITDAVIDQRAFAQQSIRSGSSVATRFVGMTEYDVEAHFDAQRRELNRLTVLNLVASTEATIKVDFFRRVREKLKDPLSRAYLQWYRQLTSNKKRRPDFDEGGILDVIKNAGVMDKNVVGQFRQCLRIRHWVGHGRYWGKPSQVDLLEPNDVSDRAQAILRALAMP